NKNAGLLLFLIGIQADVWLSWKLCTISNTQYTTTARSVPTITTISSAWLKLCATASATATQVINYQPRSATSHRCGKLCDTVRQLESPDKGAVSTSWIMPDSCSLARMSSSSISTSSAAARQASARFEATCMWMAAVESCSGR
ncbi:hypothetical protein T492DRAFT_1127242, partial [Pavlovales sp. CCMP2436]